MARYDVYATVTEVVTNRKPVRDFLLVASNKLSHVSHRVRDIGTKNKFRNCRFYPPHSRSRSFTVICRIEFGLNKLHYVPKKAVP